MTFNCSPDFRRAFLLPISIPEVFVVLARKLAKSATQSFV